MIDISQFMKSLADLVATKASVKQYQILYESTFKKPVPPELIEYYEELIHGESINGNN